MGFDYSLELRIGVSNTGRWKLLFENVDLSSFEGLWGGPMQELLRQVSDAGVTLDFSEHADFTISIHAFRKREKILWTSINEQVLEHNGLLGLAQEEKFHGQKHSAGALAIMYQALKIAQPAALEVIEECKAALQEILDFELTFYVKSDREILAADATTLAQIGTDEESISEACALFVSNMVRRLGDQLHKGNMHSLLFATLGRNGEVMPIYQRTVDSIVVDELVRHKTSPFSGQQGVVEALMREFFLMVFASSKAFIREDAEAAEFESRLKNVRASALGFDANEYWQDSPETALVLYVTRAGRHVGSIRFENFMELKPRDVFERAKSSFLQALGQFPFVSDDVVFHSHLEVIEVREAPPVQLAVTSVALTGAALEDARPLVENIWKRKSLFVIYDLTEGVIWKFTTGALRKAQSVYNKHVAGVTGLPQFPNSQLL